MAHTPESRARSYAKVRQRRIDWFKENGPCRKCGSWENLELDHIDPETKTTHNIWSWSEPKRLAELAKCQALCNPCHKEKTKLYVQELFTFTVCGTHSKYASGCRCDDCKIAQRIYNQKWRANK